MSIDLNADLGEGMDDSAILPLVTSANIACGMHAGDPEVMDRTVALALANRVQIGAHPGYPDRANFGRRPLQMSLEAVENLVLYQVAALDGFIRSRHGTLRHVKPHGALYNQAAKDLELARAVARGVKRFHPTLVLVGLAGSKLVQAAKEVGLPVAEEAFADRRYLPDGSLMPRDRPGAVLTDPEDAAAQATLIATERCVAAEGGLRIPLRADTLCLHGDTPGARSIAVAIRDRLTAAGIPIAPLSSMLAPT
jgi:UPF0271 protein